MLKKVLKTATIMAITLLTAIQYCFAISYEYDNADRVNKTRYKDGLTIEYTYTKTGNLTLIMRKYNYYTISFESNGGSEVEIATFRAGEQTTEPTEPQKFGHNFAGWFADQECTQEYIFLKMPWRNITLYAKWEVKPEYEWYISDQSADEFEISNENEIHVLSKLVSNGEDFSGKSILLKNDINLATELLPIGDITNKFNGNFNGNGNKIENIIINAENIDCQGLFGAIGADSVIQNLKVLNISIKGKNDVGAIAGNSEGLIINCLVEGAVTGSQNVGGIVGVNSGDIVNIQSKIAIQGTDYVGGIVGKNSGYITLCIAAEKLCDFSTDNFGTVAGYTSDSGHITNVYFAYDELIAKILQPFGKNSQYIYYEMCENAYYFYFMGMEEEPDFLPGYMAQLEYVYIRMDNKRTALNGKYRDYDLYTWQEMQANEDNYPCILVF